MDPLRNSYPRPPPHQSGRAEADLTGRPAADAGLRLPPPGGPNAGAGGGHVCPPEFATLPRQVIDVVAGWTAGTTPRLPVHLREMLVRELTDLLVDAAHREAYADLLSAVTVERTAWRRFEASRPPTELPLGEVAASGLARLSDVALVALALDPLHLDATAQMIDCLAECGKLGRVWWDAMACCGAAAYPEVTAAARLVHGIRGVELTPCPVGNGLSPGTGLED